jgi:hypothetical protein
MAGVKNDRIAAPPARVVRGSSIEIHWWSIILQFLIVVGGIIGVVLAAASGLETLAFVIALFTAAIIAGVNC